MCYSRTDPASAFSLSARGKPRDGMIRAIGVLLSLSMMGHATSCHAQTKQETQERAPSDKEASSGRALDNDDAIDSLEVTYDPRELADKVQVRRLLDRLDRTALHVCGEEDGISLPVRLAIERSDCHRDSLRRSVTAIHHPLLTQLAEESLRQLPASATLSTKEPSR